MEDKESGGSEGYASEGEGEANVLSSFVKEAEELKALIATLDQSEANRGKICTILDKYQEQPQLLDQHLESLVTPLTEFLRISKEAAQQKDEHGNLGAERAALQRACSVLYVIAKVRGFKTVVKFFPHHVADLEPCLELLESLDPSDGETWEIRYVLLLWLSILVLVPFSLETIDSSSGGGSKAMDTEGMINKIIEACKSCLAEAAKTRDAAAYLLSQLLTRPDMEGSKLTSFLHWSRSLLATSDNQFAVAGIQLTLSHIFKHGQRHGVLDKVPLAVDVLHWEEGKNRTTLQRHYMCKLAQRLGLTCLPARVAPWRYQRGCRSLLDNLTGSSNAGGKANLPKEGAEDVEEDDDFVPMEIDHIVDILLQGLQDRDTVVRWSAAKGIGRVTARLPKHLADEVVQAVVKLLDFELRSSVDSQHGGCLALAELARRGLLLPDRLPEVVPLVTKALSLDVRLGSASVGANVRDAACYVCWAFARAYSPNVMAPYVQQIAQGLLVLAVYDREINCRRAASAAFQENVGRQGNFPHGIDIVTKADYFAVGNRNNSFLKIAPFVGQYEAYLGGLFDHLMYKQLKHWDKSMRVISALALRKLVPLNPTRAVEQVLPFLVGEALSSDLPTRHGATLGVAEVVLGLVDSSTSLGPESQEKIAGLVPAIEKARLFRGRGGEVMRGACCRVLEAVAVARFPLSQAQITKMVDTITENLKHPTEEISRSAVAALSQVSSAYFGEMESPWIEKLASKYVTTACDDPNPAARRGFALALGAFTEDVLNANLDLLVDGLITASTRLEENAEERDAEARRNAVEALVTAVKTLGFAGCHDGAKGLNKESSNKVVEALLRAMQDYCTDNRGDVGSWVRMAAMDGIALVCGMMCAADKAAGKLGDSAGVWSDSICVKVIRTLLQQLSEKIDRVRSCAGAALSKIINPPDFETPFIPERSLLWEVLQIGAEEAAAVDWGSPSAAFPRLAKLLDNDTYRDSVLSGFVVSVGGISESTIKHSWSSMMQVMQAAPDVKALATSVGDSLSKLIHEAEKQDRVIVPAFKTAHLLLSNGCFDCLQPPESVVPKTLLERVQVELRGCKDVVKLESGLSVVATLLQFSDRSVRYPCLQTLLALLCHKYSRVRRKAGEELYMQLLTYDGIVDPEKMEEVSSILVETDWAAEIATVKLKRDELYVLLDVQRAETQRPAPSVDGAARPSAPRDDQGYQQLVKEMHY